MRAPRFVRSHPHGSPAFALTRNHSPANFRQTFFAALYSSGALGGTPMNGCLGEQLGASGALQQHGAPLELVQRLLGDHVPKVAPLVERALLPLSGRHGVPKGFVRVARGPVKRTGSLWSPVGQCLELIGESPNGLRKENRDALPNRRCNIRVRVEHLSQSSVGAKGARADACISGGPAAAAVKYLHHQGNGANHHGREDRDIRSHVQVLAPPRHRQLRRQAREPAPSGHVCCGNHGLNQARRSGARASSHMPMMPMR